MNRILESGKTKALLLIISIPVVWIEQIGPTSLVYRSPSRSFSFPEAFQNRSLTLSVVESPRRSL